MKELAFNIEDPFASVYNFATYLDEYVIYDHSAFMVFKLDECADLGVDFEFFYIQKTDLPRNLTPVLCEQVPASDINPDLFFLLKKLGQAVNA